MKYVYVITQNNHNNLIRIEEKNTDNYQLNMEWGIDDLKCHKCQGDLHLDILMNSWKRTKEWTLKNHPELFL